jgi:hypothetical protein
LKFVKRSSEIRNPDGSTVFKLDNIDIPESWSQLAIDILAQKYFRKAGVPQRDDAGNPILGPDGKPALGGERDAKQVFERMAGCWTHWGKTYGYFKTIEDSAAFHDELCFMLAHQMAAPNSPQWFNTGLHYAYGLSGPAQGHFTSIRKHERSSRRQMPSSTPSRTPVLYSQSRMTWSTRTASWTFGSARHGSSSMDQGREQISRNCAETVKPCQAVGAPPV